MNLEDFQSLIQESVDTRREEMTQVMRVISLCKSTPVEQTSIIMAIPVIYAHWEGFVKEALTLYLDYIEKQVVSPDSIHPNVLSFHMRSRLKVLIDSGSVERCAEFARWMLNTLSKPIEFPDKAIDTQGNLSYDNLKSLCDTLYVNVTSLNDRKRKVNSLVCLRNNIAHTGRPLSMEGDAVEGHKQLAMNLIEDFGMIIIESAKASAFSYPGIESVHT